MRIFSDYTLITRKNDTKKHVSLTIVEEFENSIELSENLATIDNKSVFRAKTLRILLKKNAIKLSFLRNFLNNYTAYFVNSLSEHSLKKRVFTILMGPNYEKVFPYYLSSCQKNVYMFDAWPEKHQSIEKFLEVADIDNVFFSSNQVTEIFKAKNLKTRAHWIPEGILPSNYKFHNYNQKDIDVLQFGRRYNELHNLIVEPLEKKSIKYLYQREAGEIIFASNDAFLEGLARTKISICIPSNITHPERSGNISTMTVRYLQSMLSKCLVIGIIPAEMKLLFDYDPIIQIDMNNPADQIEYIIKNMDSFIPLIEKNYHYVLSHHTWLNRWQMIKEIIT